VQRFGHDQGARGGIPHRGPAALPVRPAAGVRLPGAVGEDHLAWRRMLDVSGEGQVLLVPGRVPHLERAGDGGDVEDRDRDGEGQRDRVAQVDERMQPWQAPLLAEPAQQRLRRAAVLGGLEPQLREGPPPGLDLRQLALGAHRRQPGLGDGREPVGSRAGRRVAGDALGVQDPGNQRREASPDRRRMLEVHGPPSSLRAGREPGRRRRPRGRPRPAAGAPGHRAGRRPPPRPPGPRR
jgi:hypothetical protein